VLDTDRGFARDGEVLAAGDELRVPGRSLWLFRGELG
jgi:hypothetical protein